jgi:hypothetical protein
MSRILGNVSIKQLFIGDDLQMRTLAGGNFNMASRGASLLDVAQNPPEPPSSVSVVPRVDGSSASVSWDAPGSGVAPASYTLTVYYASDSAVFQTWAGLTETSKVVYALSSETRYFVTVKSVDASGNVESDPAYSSVFQTPDVTAPDELQGLTAASRADASTLDVSWEASSATDLASYTVYVDRTGSLTNVNVTVVDGKFVLDPTPTLGTGSRYVFIQEDSSNTGHPLRFSSSDQSSEFLGDLTFEGTPGSAGAKVTVDFLDAGSVYAFCTVHGYGMGSTLNPLTVNSEVSTQVVSPVTGITDTSYVVTGLSTESKYTVFATAVDTSNNASTPASAAVVTGDVTPPSKVEGVTNTPQSNGSEVQVNWTELDSSFSYRLRVIAANNVTVIQDVSGITTNSYYITGLDSETQYRITVAAIDLGGNEGEQSSQSIATTPDVTAPSQVQDVVAVADENGRDVSVSFTEYEDASVYTVRVYASDGVNVVKTSTGNASSPVVVGGLDPSTQYFATVSAIDVAGNVGQQSTQVSFTTTVDTTIPDPPTSFSGTFQDNNIAVDFVWTASASSDVASYTINIYLSDDTLLQTISGITGTSYTVEGLTSETEADYKADIKAIDVGGLVGTATDKILFSRSGWATLTASDTGTTQDPTVDDGSITDTAFSEDGLTMYAATSSPPAVYEYSLSVAYDVSTATQTSSYTLTDGNMATNIESITFNENGTVMYLITHGSPNKILFYNMTSAFDLSTASFDTSVDDIYEQNTGNVPKGMDYYKKGNKEFLMVTGDDGSLFTVEVTPGSRGKSRIQASASLDYNYDSLQVKPDGRSMWATKEINGVSHIFEYRLTTPFDLSSISLVNSSSLGRRVSGIHLDKRRGRKLFLAERNTNKIHEYQASEDIPTLLDPPATVTASALSNGTTVEVSWTAVTGAASYVPRLFISDATPTPVLTPVSMSISVFRPWPVNEDHQNARSYYVYNYASAYVTGYATAEGTYKGYIQEPTDAGTYQGIAQPPYLTAFAGQYSYANHYLRADTGDVQLKFGDSQAPSDHLGSDAALDIAVSADGYTFTFSDPAVAAIYGNTYALDKYILNTDTVDLGSDGIVTAPVLYQSNVPISDILNPKIPNLDDPANYPVNASLTHVYGYMFRDTVTGGYVLTKDHPTELNDTWFFTVNSATFAWSNVYSRTLAKMASGVTGTLQTFTGLTSETNYYATVASHDGTNQGAQSDPQVPVTTPDVTPPEPVTDLSMTAEELGTSILAQWTTNQDIDTHILKLYSPDSSTLVGTFSGVTGNAYTFTGLTSETTYYASVTSVDESGNIGQESTKAQATTPDITPPEEISGVTLTQLTGTILRADWSVPTGEAAASYNARIYDGAGPLPGATAETYLDFEGDDAIVLDPTGGLKPRYDLSGVYKFGTRSCNGSVAVAPVGLAAFTSTTPAATRDHSTHGAQDIYISDNYDLMVADSSGSFRHHVLDSPAGTETVLAYYPPLDGTQTITANSSTNITIDVAGSSHGDHGYTVTCGPAPGNGTLLQQMFDDRLDYDSRTVFPATISANIYFTFPEAVVINGARLGATVGDYQKIYGHSLHLYYKDPNTNSWIEIANTTYTYTNSTYSGKVEAGEQYKILGFNNNRAYTMYRIKMDRNRIESSYKVFANLKLLTLDHGHGLSHFNAAVANTYQGKTGMTSFTHSHDGYRTWASTGTDRKIWCQNFQHDNDLTFSPLLQYAFYMTTDRDVYTIRYFTNLDKEFLLFSGSDDLLGVYDVHQIFGYNGSNEGALSVHSSVTSSSTGVSMAFRAIDIDTTGTRIFAAPYSGTGVVEFSLSSPFDISTCYPTGRTFDVTYNVGSISMSWDQKHMFLIDSSTDYIHEYQSATAMELVAPHKPLSYSAWHYLTLDGSGNHGIMCTSGFGSTDGLALYAKETSATTFKFALCSRREGPRAAGSGLKPDSKEEYHDYSLYESSEITSADYHQTWIHVGLVANSATVVPTVYLNGAAVALTQDTRWEDWGFHRAGHAQGLLSGACMPVLGPMESLNDLVTSTEVYDINGSVGLHQGKADELDGMLAGTTTTMGWDSVSGSTQPYVYVNFSEPVTVHGLYIKMWTLVDQQKIRVGRSSTDYEDTFSYSGLLKPNNYSEAYAKWYLIPLKTPITGITQLYFKWYSTSDLGFGTVWTGFHVLGNPASNADGYIDDLAAYGSALTSTDMYTLSNAGTNVLDEKSVSVTTTSFDGLSEGGRYTVVVMPVDSSANVGSASEPSSLTMADLTPPAVPSGLSLSTTLRNYTQASQTNIGGGYYPHGITFSPDGTKAASVSVTDDRVREYTLSTGFNFSTRSNNTDWATSTQIQFPRDIAFDPTGYYLYVSGHHVSDGTSGRAVRYILSTQWDAGTKGASETLDLSALGVHGGYGCSCVLGTDGTEYLYVLTGETGALSAYQVNQSSFASSTLLGTSGDLVAVINTALGTDYEKPHIIQGVAVNKTGTRAYVTVYNSDKRVVVLAMSTPYDPRTISEVEGIIYLADATEWDYTGMHLKEDESLIMLCEKGGTSGNVIRVDLSNAGYDSVVASSRTTDQNAVEYTEGFELNLDQTELYQIGTDRQSVDFFNLGTTSDITTVQGLSGSSFLVDGASIANYDASYATAAFAATGPVAVDVTGTKAVGKVDAAGDQASFVWYSIRPTSGLHTGEEWFSGGLEMRDVDGNQLIPKDGSTVLWVKDTLQTPVAVTVTDQPPAMSSFTVGTSVNAPNEVGPYSNFETLFSFDGRHSVHASYTSGAFTQATVSFHTFTTPFDPSSGSTHHGTHTITANSRLRGMIGATEDPTAPEYGKVFYAFTNPTGTSLKIVLTSAWDPSAGVSVANSNVVPYLVWGGAFTDSGLTVALTRDSDILVFNLSSAYDLSTISDLNSPDHTVASSDVGLDSYGLSINWVSSGNFVYINNTQGDVTLFDCTSNPYDYTLITASNRLEHDSSTFTGGDAKYSMAFDQAAPFGTGSKGIYTSASILIPFTAGTSSSTTYTSLILGDGTSKKITSNYSLTYTQPIYVGFSHSGQVAEHRFAYPFLQGDLAHPWRTPNNAVVSKATGGDASSDPRNLTFSQLFTYNPESTIANFHSWPLEVRSEKLTMVQLSTAWDASTAGAATDSSGVLRTNFSRCVTGAVEDSTQAEYGKLFFLLGDQSEVTKYTVSSAFSLNGGSWTTEREGASGNPRITFAQFFSGGMSLGIYESTTDTLRAYSLGSRYSLTEASWNISSPTYTVSSATSTLGLSGNIAGVSWVSSGNFAFVTDTAGTVKLFDALDSPYDYRQLLPANEISSGTPWAQPSIAMETTEGKLGLLHDGTTLTSVRHTGKVPVMGIDLGAMNHYAVVGNSDLSKLIFTARNTSGNTYQYFRVFDFDSSVSIVPLIRWDLSSDTLPTIPEAYVDFTTSTLVSAGVTNMAGLRDRYKLYDSTGSTNTSLVTNDRSNFITLDGRTGLEIKDNGAEGSIYIVGNDPLYDGTRLKELVSNTTTLKIWKSSNLNPGPFTVSAYIRLTSRENHVIVGMYGSHYLEPLMVSLIGDKLRPNFWLNNGSTRQYAADIDLSLNTWYHVAFTFVYPSTVAACYVDGVYVPPDDYYYGNSIMGTPRQTMSIAGRSDRYVCVGGSYHMHTNGPLFYLSDLRFYGHALTATQMLEVYQGTVPSTKTVNLRTNRQITEITNSTSYNGHGLAYVKDSENLEHVYLAANSGEIIHYLYDGDQTFIHQETSTNLQDTIDGVVNENHTPQDMYNVWVSPDGTKLFTILYQKAHRLCMFGMSTPYDVSTATLAGYDRISLPRPVAATELRVNADMTKLWVSQGAYGAESSPVLSQFNLAAIVPGPTAGTFPQARLTWTPDTEAASYVVNVYDSDGTTVLQSTPGVTDNVYYASGLTSGQQYYLAVAGVDAVGNQSAFTSPVSLIPPDYTAPDPVSDLTVTRTYDSGSNSTTFAASWTPTAETVHVTVRLVDPDGVTITESQESHTSTSYDFQAVTGTGAYSVQVVPFDLSGNQGAQSSAEAYAGPAMTFTVSGTASYSSNNNTSTVTVRFRYVSNYTDSPTPTFEIFRNSNQTGLIKTQAANAASIDTTFSETQTPIQSRTYYVRMSKTGMPNTDLSFNVSNSGRKRTPTDFVDVEHVNASNGCTIHRFGHNNFSQYMSNRSIYSGYPANPSDTSMFMRNLGDDPWQYGSHDVHLASGTRRFIRFKFAKATETLPDPFYVYYKEGETPVPRFDIYKTGTNTLVCRLTAGGSTNVTSNSRTRRRTAYSVTNYWANM